MLETQYTSLEMRCGTCQVTWEAPVARVVNVETHPDARLGILLQMMHHTHCPVCRRDIPIDAIFDYYDPAQQLVVQVRPEWEYAAGGGEDWYWARYEDLVEKYKEHEVRVDVVFGFQQMIDKYLGGEAAVAEGRREYDARKAKAIAEAEGALAAESDDTPEAPSEPSAP